MKKIVFLFIFTAILSSFSVGFFLQYTYPALVPSGFTVEYAAYLLSNKLFQKSLISTMILGISCGFFSTTLGFLISRGIVKLEKKKQKFFIGFFTLPLFFPAISMFIGVHVMMMKLNLANTFWGILIAHLFLTIPYAMNIGISYFSGISRDIETTSQLLGASRFKTFVRIILPLISGGLGLSFSMTFLISVSEYFATFLIGGGTMVTLSGLMYPYIANFDMTNAALLSMVFVMINVAVFAISNIWMKKHSYLY